MVKNLNYYIIIISLTNYQHMNKNTNKYVNLKNINKKILFLNNL